MSTPDKCPHCGREILCSQLGTYACTCGTYSPEALELSQERSAHAVTMRKLETAEARVKELEGLELIGRYAWTQNEWIVELLMPPGITPDVFRQKTLGEALPRKEQSL